MCVHTYYLSVYSPEVAEIGTIVVWVTLDVEYPVLIESKLHPVVAIGIVDVAVSVADVKLLWVLAELSKLVVITGKLEIVDNASLLTEVAEGAELLVELVVDVELATDAYSMDEVSFTLAKKKQ